ncbi:hypothetical protein [Spirosoma pollinicola]|uniref:DUF5723 domain-containing protein n=1 Tax=Spirosoma pollinicola TaxID=2057025 RepID=A0A2K8YUI9_9BACT|nr:hypothetical protein [Spirosoma pollinicola]AUD01283.1 hypothetical protein CWM47_05345 [Spirosoma pollinicola]
MNRLLFVLLLSPLLGSAQATIDTLHWSATRRIQLTDFHAPIQTGLGGSEFHYQIGYEVHPTSVWSQPAIDAFCLMFRNLSWVSETARNDRTLAYNQVLFDLVEIHTRLMKAKLIALQTDRHFKQQATQIEYLTNAELGAEVNRFRAETGGGDDLPILKQWQLQVAQRLYDTPDLVTTFQSSKIGYSMFLGVGGIAPTGPLVQTLDPAAGVVFGLDIAFKRTMLLLHPTLYNGTLRSGFWHQNQRWEKDMPVSSTLFEIGLGRIVNDSPRSRFIPYVGYRLLDLSPRDRTDERYKGLALINHAPTVGIMLDIKLGNNTRRNDHSEDSFWFVRTKVSYSPLLTAEAFSGGLINIQISLGGFSRIRKVTYQPERTLIPLPAGSLN